MIQTLSNIELLALSGAITVPLAGLTAGMLRSEIENYHETLLEAMERAVKFVATVKEMAS